MSSESELGFSAFISHDSADTKIATRVCLELEKAGFRCWIAPRDVRPGQDYPTEIIRGIELSKCLVLVLSKTANELAFVRAEVERAYSKGKPIFPFRIEEILPSRSLELFISTKHWIDAWRGEITPHIDRLSKELALDTNLQLDVSPELRRRVRMKRYMRYGGLGLGVAAVALLVSYMMRPPPIDLTDARPVTAFFMGGMVSEKNPIEVSYMFTDGWDKNGKYYGALNAITAFNIYELVPGADPKPIYSADPKQFEDQYLSTKSYNVTIDGLPKKILSCVIYRNPTKDSLEATLQKFNFSQPDSPFGTFPAQEATEPKVVDDKAGHPCQDLVDDYARTL